MKRNLLLLTLGLSGTAFAQDNKILQLAPQHPLYRSETVHLGHFVPGADSLAKAMRIQLAKTGKPYGVIRLPQDNMPCIVTADATVGQISNAWTGDVPTGIPNPARREKTPGMNRIPGKG